MWERYQSLARTVRERIAPVLAIPLTGGVALDFWSHPYPNNQFSRLLPHLLSGTEADLARRTTIAAIPKIGPALSTHIGNFGYSAAMMIPITYFGIKVKEYGKSKDSKVIETIGDIIPFVGFLGIVAINILAERMASNHTQFWGDLLFGLGGAIMAHVVTKGARERFQTKDQQATVEINRSSMVS